MQDYSDRFENLGTLFYGDGSISRSHRMNNDSPRNWRISSPRPAPNALRTPISLARRADWAVVRFTKLMPASSKMKTAKALKIQM